MLLTYLEIVHLPMQKVYKVNKLMPLYLFTLENQDGGTDK